MMGTEDRFFNLVRRNTKVDDRVETLAEIHVISFLIRPEPLSNDKIAITKNKHTAVGRQIFPERMLAEANQVLFRFQWKLAWPEPHSYP